MNPVDAMGKQELDRLESLLMKEIPAAQSLLANIRKRKKRMAKALMPVKPRERRDGT